MIDFRKNMKTMALNKANVSCFSTFFRVTTVKSDQKSNINIYCILFCAISIHFTTIKNMVVVTIATIIKSAMNHVLNGSCLSKSQRKTNFTANSWFPFNLYLTEGLNEA
tara:strand:+ start:928 stop:1254 length:327 start_codon:yes stop_codon:yes gene_type:complete